MDNEKFHTCTMTYEQYNNFKILPIIREVIILKRNQQNFHEHTEDMDEAIEMIEKNDFRNIHKLSVTT